MSKKKNEEVKPQPVEVKKEKVEGQHESLTQDPNVRVMVHVAK